MRHVTSLTALPGGKAIAEAVAQRPGAILGAVSWDRGQRLRVWGPGCSLSSQQEALAGAPATAVVWDSTAAAQPRNAGRTQQALELLTANPGLSPHAAARQAGVHVSAVYRALARAQRPVCECCGRRLPGQ